MGYVMPLDRSIDMDTELDFDLARTLLAVRRTPTGRDANCFEIKQLYPGPKL